MARYSLQARIEEERYANCIRNKITTEKTQLEQVELLDKKQMVTTEIISEALGLVEQSMPTAKPNINTPN